MAPATGTFDAQVKPVYLTWSKYGHTFDAFLSVLVSIFPIQRLRQWTSVIIPQAKRFPVARKILRIIEAKMYIRIGYEILTAYRLLLVIPVIRAFGIDRYMMTHSCPLAYSEIQSSSRMVTSHGFRFLR